jgi:hypothetical protein
MVATDFLSEMSDRRRLRGGPKVEVTLELGGVVVIEGRAKGSVSLRMRAIRAACSFRITFRSPCSTSVTVAF